MKKVLLFVVAALMLCGLFGGFYAYKNQLLFWAPKETVTEEVEIPAESPAEDL